MKCAIGIGVGGAVVSLVGCIRQYTGVWEESVRNIICICFYHIFFNCLFLCMFCNMCNAFLSLTLLYKQINVHILRFYSCIK